MSVATASTIPVRRAFYRLHLSTWVFTAAIAGVLFLLNVPGSSAVSVDVFDHGWPWVYGQSYSKHQSPPLFSPSRGSDPRRVGDWNWTFDFAGFEARPFELDLAVALATIFIVAMVFEMRRRRRRNAWQLSLVDFLVATVFVGMCCAWWLSWRAQENRQRYALRWVQEAPAETGQISARPYSGPRWIAHFVGANRLPATFRPVRNVEIRREYSKRQKPERVESQRQSSSHALSLLHTVRFVKLVGSGIDDRFLASAATLPELDTLELHDASISIHGLRQLEAARNLRHLNLNLRPMYDTVSSPDLRDELTHEKLKVLQAALPTVEITITGWPRSFLDPPDPRPGDDE